MATLYERFNSGGDFAASLYHPYYPGQTFTIGTVGTNTGFVLEKIKIHVEKVANPTGSLTIEIYAADGANNLTGGVISSGSLAYASISAAGWYDINMSAVTLKASTQYAYCVALPGTDSTNKVKLYCVDSSSGYAGGLALLTYNAGGDNYPDKNVDRDYYFELWGYPLTTHAEVLDTVTSEIDTAVTNEYSSPLNEFHFVAISQDQQVMFIQTV